MTVHAARRDLAAVAIAIVIALSIIVAGRSDPIPLGFAAGFIALMMSWIAWQDVKTFSLPDGAITGLFLVGSALRLVDPLQGVFGECLAIALDVALCAGTLLIVRETYFRFRGVDGLGFGDVKLAGAGAALLGTVDFAVALFVASAAGCLFVFAARLFSRWRLIDRLPFGAFLAPACGFIWVFSPSGL